MKKKVKNLQGLLLLLIVLFVGILVYIEPSTALNDFARNRNSLTLDIWILERSSMDVDLTGLERRIVFNYGVVAIPKLEKCVDKFEGKGDMDKADRCSSLIDWINDLNK